MSYIGANATILPGLKVGVGCTVGAGAVVTCDVPDGNTVMGIPAR
jgi:acetyltransferase-like isoleucine patch superfamily enzyme